MTSLASVLVPVLLAAEEPPFPVAGDAELRVEAHWDAVQDTEYELAKEDPGLGAALCSGPEEVERWYTAEDFRGLLPPDEVAVGDLWPLPEEAVLRCLGQFRRGATMDLHYGARGAYGCVRALSPTRAEFVFRVHAEFRIDAERTFTPAQFHGSLLWDRVDGLPLAFRWYLPPRNSNALMLSRNRADIGSVPRMELVGGEQPAEEPWDAELDAEAADRLLERNFYPFAAVEWLPLERAVARVREVDLPLHVVVLWGVLDDESC